jgi:hypothetical protein
MKHVLALLLFTLAFTGTAQADVLFPIDEIDIIEEKPVNSCNLEKKSKLHRVVAQIIRDAQSSLKCGDYEATYEALLGALQGVEDLMIASTGYCYSKANCKGAKVSGQKVTKAECEATGVGASWQQVDPLGACINI